MAFRPRIKRGFSLAGARTLDWLSEATEVGPETHSRTVTIGMLRKSLYLPTAATRHCYEPENPIKLCRNPQSLPWKMEPY